MIAGASRRERPAKFGVARHQAQSQACRPQIACQVNNERTGGERVAGSPKSAVHVPPGQGPTTFTGWHWAGIDRHGFPESVPAS